ncbi:hypothetical protein CH380_03530 [Leptospira adleri]|uniref:Uncharacterized protein n=1 Tax=Leptospira adleri TaxID=2023186 RepID=A0A2M9YTE6_9LEPT|nr:hypothetical protein CH380_03530 [Leptospira adleri]PJZ61457.1 hypothetical protein CH376_13255 [Leptospira adleri]
MYFPPVVQTTIFRVKKAPHPRWVVEAGWRGKVGGISLNRKNAFCKGEFEGPHSVGVPTL